MYREFSLLSDLSWTTKYYYLRALKVGNAMFYFYHFTTSNLFIFLKANIALPTVPTYKHLKIKMTQALYLVSYSVLKWKIGKQMILIKHVFLMFET